MMSDSAATHHRSDRSKTDPTPHRRFLMPLLFAVLFCFWMFPGLIGRDPWKADEAYSFGLVLNMIETGDYVVPTLGADPFLEKPPVFYITGALFGRLFSPALQLHDAARLASAFYLGLTLWFLALASRELDGRGRGWVAGVVLLGCIGNVHNAHMLVTDNSLLTGFSLALYGLALGLRRPWLGGMLAGTGVGLAFLSKGLLGPGIIGLAMLGLPAAFKAWRTRDYLRVLAGAVGAALPWILIWPALLYERSPQLFHVWFWNNNVERFLGVGLGASDTTPFHYLKQLPLLAWPALPLALWSLWRERQGALRQPGVQLPLLYFLAILFVLSLAGQRRSNYLPPLLPPLALLAVRCFDGFNEQTVRWINRIVFGVFSFAAAAVWLAWLAHLAGFPASMLDAIRRVVAGYVPTVHIGLLAAALAATIAWVLLVVLHRRESWFVAVHWTAGLALAYCLGMTLWLPFANGNMSYRNDLAGLREALGPNPGLVGGRKVDEPQRAMIHYFGGVRVHSEEFRGPVDCEWMIVQGRTDKGWEPEPPDPSWRLAWQGTHHRELFHLYRKGR